MKEVIGSVLLFIGFSTSVPAASVTPASLQHRASSEGDEPFSCDLKALDGSQRERMYALGRELAGGVKAREEIGGGYAFLGEAARLPLDRLAAWVELVAKCCPFLDYGIDVRDHGRDVTLRITGGRGARAFIQDEFPELFAATRSGAGHDDQ